MQEPFPEEERFHHAQFSLTDAGSKALTPFTGKPGKSGGKREGKSKKGKGDDDDGRWRQEWSNRVAQADLRDDAKHLWREARVFGLAEVFAKFGDRYTAKQLYRHYLASRILVHKREHGASAPDRRAAALERCKATGYYGFGKG